MKKTIVILSIFFLSISGYAQKFIDPTKVWFLETKGFSDGNWLPATAVSYKFIGDTIVDNKTYAKMYWSIKPDQSDWEFSSLWREDEPGKIFWRYHNTGEELIYDFNLTVGDTIKTRWVPADAIVDSVLIKPFGSVNKKYLYLHLIDVPAHTLTWIEGIGSLFNPNVPDDFWVTGGTSKLICFEENGVLVYHNPEYSDCFLTSISTLKNDQTFIELQLTQGSEIQIYSKSEIHGEIFFNTLDGKQVLNQSVNLRTTTICLPTKGNSTLPFHKQSKRSSNR